MAKFKLKPLIKYQGKDKYIFINGLAVVPGIKIKGEKVLIGLKDFNKFSRED